MMEQLADYTIRQTMRESNHGLIFLAEPPERLGITDEVVALNLPKSYLNFTEPLWPKSTSS